MAFFLPGEIAKFKQQIIAGYDDKEFKMFLIDFLSERLELYTTASGLDLQLSEFLSQFGRDDQKVANLVLLLHEHKKNDQQDFTLWLDRAKLAQRAMEKMATVVSEPNQMVLLEGRSVFIGRNNIKKALKLQKNNGKSSGLLLIKGVNGRCGVSYCHRYFNHLEKKCDWFRTAHIDLQDLFDQHQQRVTPFHVYAEIVKHLPAFALTDGEFDEAQNNEQPKIQPFFNNCVANKEKVEIPHLIFIDQIKNADIFALNLPAFIRDFVDLVLDRLQNICLVIEANELFLSPDARAQATTLQLGSFSRDDLETFFEQLYDEIDLLFEKPPGGDKTEFVTNAMSLLTEFTDFNAQPNVEPVGVWAQNFFQTIKEQMLES